MIVFDSDDFGCNHVLSDVCQSHDCRDQLDKLHYANPNFKATLFAIPAEMTYEMMEWCDLNRGWIELAVHGFYHRSNYECEKWTYEDMDKYMAKVENNVFVKGFKAPGWQISDDCFRWLADHGWWVADQHYNNGRRPFELSAYINKDGQFSTTNGAEINGIHTHTWNCVGNGIYELYDSLVEKMKDETDFKFVSEVAY